MTTTREKMIASQLHTIEKAQRAIDDLVYYPIEIIEQAFSEAKIDWWFSTEIEVTLPLRFSLINDVRLFMQEQFPETRLVWDHQCVWDDTGSAGHFLKYELPCKEAKYHVIQIEFGFRSKQEGSTCLLNKIGTKEVPVYEVTCPDAASEPTWKE